MVDELALAILATLAAFGVTVTAQGGIDEVAPWVMDKFEEFVDSTGESLSNVRSQIRYGVNKAGDLIGNAYALSFNARFAQWLDSEYSFTDNSSIDLSGSPYYYLGDVPVAYMSSTIWTYQGAPFYPITGLSGTDVYTMMFRYYPGSSGNRAAFISFSGSPFTFTAHELFAYHSSVETDQGVYYYAIYSGSQNVNANWFTPNAGLFLGSGSSASYSVEQVLAYIRNNSVLAPDGSTIVINTGALDIPQVGDYDDDDGILIDGFGSWGDTLQDIWGKISGLTVPDVAWPTVTWGAELADQLVDSLVSAGELTTENSPGFYNGLPLIGGIPDIQFGNLWHYVTDWVGSMSGGLALIGGIMFSLPFVAAFYALVVILLVLSLWRLLRSA